MSLRECSKSKVPQKTYEFRDKILEEEIYNEKDGIITRVLDIPVSLVKEIKSLFTTYTSLTRLFVLLTAIKKYF